MIGLQVFSEAFKPTMHPVPMKILQRLSDGLMKVLE
jgi:hypothetical protein